MFDNDNASKVTGSISTYMVVAKMLRQLHSIGANLIDYIHRIYVFYIKLWVFKNTRNTMMVRKRENNDSCIIKLWCTH